MSKYEKYMVFEDFSEFEHKDDVANSQEPWVVKREESIKLREKKKFEEGKALGIEEGYNSKRHELDEKLIAVENMMAEKLTEMNGIIEKIEEKTKISAGELALTIVNTLVPATIRKYPYAEVEKLVSDCMVHIEADYNIVIRVASEMREKLQERLENMAKESSFKGTVLVKSDDSLKGVDCEIEWPEGGIIRDMGKVVDEINMMLKRRNVGGKVNIETEASEEKGGKSLNAEGLSVGSSNTEDVNG